MVLNWMIILKSWKKMLAIYPESDRINHAIARLLFDAKRFNEGTPGRPNDLYTISRKIQTAITCSGSFRKTPKLRSGD